MEVYILDDLLRRIAVIDQYESFIWTERWAVFGDFELVVHSTSENRRLLKEGTQMVQNGSDRVMTIKTVDIKKDDDGRSILTVSGPSLEQILDDRAATEGLAGPTSDTNWVISGTAGNVCRKIFKDICIDGLLSTSDKIPFIKPGTIYPPSTIPESAIVFSASIPLSSVYEAIKELCDIYDLGFRLVRNQDKSELYFDIYTGNNRTTQQNVHTPVIFSQELDNLSNVSELRSVEDAKNVAYVFGLNDSTIVYADGADASTSGFDRKVLYVDATDVTLASGPALTAVLVNKGLDALAKTRPIAAFDGEINQYGKNKYNRDYFLGDLVEMRNSDGATNIMRVTEQIFVSDGEGDRSYPTLTLNSSILPDVWDSWGTETWDGGDPDEVWDE